MGSYVNISDANKLLSRAVLWVWRKTERSRMRTRETEEFTPAVTDI